MSGNTRDDEFYLRDVIFLVEDRLFKVHACLFTDESEIFRTMFELPLDPNSKEEGTSDDKPITLEGIEIKDFKNLLRAMYARGFKEIGRFSQDEWISVLKLTTLWDMDRLREISIFRLGKILKPGQTLLSLGRKYRVDSWIVSGIEHLVSRTESLDEEAVRAVGFEMADVLKISALREWKICDGKKSVPELPQKIRNLFNLEGAI